LAEGWDGTAWSIQPTPNPVGATNGLFDAVSCSSAVSCTAVGDYNNNSGIVTLAEVWNGTAWNVESTPNPAGALGSLLGGVSCSSATACTAVGSYKMNVVSPPGNQIDQTLAEARNG
jgi:hypothetical protein